jgi:DNA-binding CsgD family transcriptional regulator
MQRCILKDFLSKLAEGKEKECWQWYGIHDTYGRAKYVINKKLTNAARILYELKVEKIPIGKQVLHTCDHRWCMNWHHFFIGTHQDNMQDKQNKGRQAKGEMIGVSKLTEQDVLSIISLLKEGNLTQQEIAKKFNIGIGPIAQIKLGTTWKHITGNKVIFRAKLTEQQRTLLIDLVTNSNKPKKEIADILDIGIVRLNNLINKLGITSKKKQQEEQILELLPSNKSYKEIAEITGTSINIINSIVEKTNIHRRQRLDTETVETVLELLKEGNSHKEIIERLEITYNNIASIVSGKSYKKVTGGHKLSRDCKKLKEDDVRQIRLWVKEGKKQKEISEILGICTDTISNIVRGKSWTQVL